MNDNDMNNEMIDIKKYINILIKGKYVIFFTILLASILGYLYSIKLIPQYSTSSKMIYEASSNKSMTSDLGALAAIVGMGSLSDGGDISDYLSDILYTHNFLSSMFDRKWQIDEYETTKYDLLKLWEIDVDTTQRDWKRVSIQKGVEKLRKDITYSVDRKTTVITISTTARTPFLAYSINNFIIESLNKVVLTKLNKKSVDNRVFVEQRLIESKEALYNAEHELKLFKNEHTLSMSPELLLQEQRLTREMKVEQEVYLTLRKQYEMAKIDEQKDIPVLSIIEEAQIPYMKSTPKKSKVIIIGALTGMFVGIFFTFLIQGYKSYRSHFITTKNI